MPPEIRDACKKLVTTDFLFLALREQYLYELMEKREFITLNREQLGTVLDYIYCMGYTRKGAGETMQKAMGMLKGMASVSAERAVVE